MPSKGTKYTTEIQQLRDEGFSDGQIAERLSIGRSIVTRNLYDDRSKQRLAKLMTQAGLYALKQVLASCEVAYRWTEIERLKQLEGKSSLTAESIGTLMRSQEKALDMAKAFLGKTISPDDLRKAEKQDPRINRAQERLRQLEAKALNGQPVEEAEKVDDDD